MALPDLLSPFQDAFLRRSRELHLGAVLGRQVLPALPGGDEDDGRDPGGRHGRRGSPLEPGLLRVSTAQAKLCIGLFLLGVYSPLLRL